MCDMIFLRYRPPLIPVKTKQKDKDNSVLKALNTKQKQITTKSETQVLICTVPTVRDCKKVRHHSVPLERKEKKTPSKK